MCFAEAAVFMVFKFWVWMFGFGLVMSVYTRRVALLIYETRFTDFGLGIGECICMVSICNEGNPASLTNIVS